MALVVGASASSPAIAPWSSPAAIRRPELHRDRRLKVKGQDGLARAGAVPSGVGCDHEDVGQRRHVGADPDVRRTGPVTCAIGDLAAGEAVSLELVLEVPDTLPPGPLSNLAAVDSDVDDPDQSNNSSLAIVEAVAQADVTLRKVLVTSNPVAGQPVEYQLILTNNGPTVAPNASL